MPEKFKLNRDEVRDIQDRFEQIVAFVRSRNGWVTSHAAEPEIRFECLPNSTLPVDLRGVGWKVEPDMPPETERILSGKIVQTERHYFPLPSLNSENR